MFAGFFSWPSPAVVKQKIGQGKLLILEDELIIKGSSISTTAIEQ